MKRRVLVVLALLFIWVAGVVGRAQPEESSFRKWAHSKNLFSTTDVMLALDRSFIELLVAALQFVANPLRSDATLYFFP